MLGTFAGDDIHTVKWATGSQVLLATLFDVKASSHPQPDHICRIAVALCPRVPLMFSLQTWLPQSAGAASLFCLWWLHCGTSTA